MTAALILSNVGRTELEERVRRLTVVCAELTASRDSVVADRELMMRENARLLAQLTDVQVRCNELLGEAREARREAREARRETRAVRAFLLRAIDPLVVALLTAIDVAREKHPEGAAIADIAEEVGELARAVRTEPEARVVAEALDVAVTAVRFAAGERRS